jgi:hypothetical protein
MLSPEALEEEVRIAEPGRRRPRRSGHLMTYVEALGDTVEVTTKFGDLKLVLPSGQ